MHVRRDTIPTISTYSSSLIPCSFASSYAFSKKSFGETVNFSTISLAAVGRFASTFTSSFSINFLKPLFKSLANFKSGEIVDVYIPVQPFHYYSDTLFTIDKILNYKFTGWLENINNNDINFSYVNNSKSNEEIEIGYYRILNISNIII